MSTLASAPYPAPKQNVDRFAADVAAHSGYVYTQGERFSARVANARLTAATLARIPAATRTVFDLGCGDGTYTQALGQAMPQLQLTGMDAAAAAVQRAGKTYQGIAFMVGDALDPDAYPKQRFDLAVVRGLLHHTADPARVIHNVSRVARRLVILEPNGRNPVLKAIEQLSAYHRAHEEQSFLPGTVARWCRQAGCVVDAVDYVGFVPFFCPAPAARLLHRLQPLLERLPGVRHLFSAVAVTCAHPEAPQ